MIRIAHLAFFDIELDNGLFGTVSVKGGSLFFIVDFLNDQLVVDPESVLARGRALEFIHASDGRGERGLELSVPVLAQSLPLEVVESQLGAVQLVVTNWLLGLLARLGDGIVPPVKPD